MGRVRAVALVAAVAGLLVVLVGASVGFGQGLSDNVVLAQTSPTRTPTPLPVRPTATPTRVVTSAAELPRFVLGFAFLKDQLGPIMGVPLESEHGSPDSCDTQQRTSTGLAGSDPQYTADESKANASVRKLAGLDVKAILPGHGEPLTAGASKALKALAAGLPA